MTDTALPAPLTTDYLHDGHTLLSWLTTTDHKRIAVMFAAAITVFFFFGAAAIAVVRLELVSPTGDLLTDDTYNKLFTIHGIVMVWFFLVPSIPAVLGNFLLPLMIGARDVAFPRLNLLSWYIFVTGATLALVSAVSGGVDTGWTFYTPYSTTYSNTHVMAMAVGVFITGF